MNLIIIILYQFHFYQLHQLFLKHFIIKYHLEIFKILPNLLNLKFYVYFHLMEKNINQNFLVLSLIYQLLFKIMLSYKFRILFLIPNVIFFCEKYLKIIKIKYQDLQFILITILCLIRIFRYYHLRIHDIESNLNTCFLIISQNFIDPL